jgi:broad specificity phosphatase PhoE
MMPNQPPGQAAVPTRLFLFRHGETLWSLSRRHTGVTDIPLTPHGETQARALQPWANATTFTQVLTSPRLRARATCDLAGLLASAQVEPDLAEWNYGDYEGRRSVDICERRRGWNIFRDGCPNGESPSAIGERIDCLIARLRTIGGDVALFSHGQFGAAFGARWIGLPVFEAQHLEFGPASMSVLGWDRDHSEIPVLALWNAVPGPYAPAATPR